ncbi:CRISPR-associated endonuclease Cas1 [soil metagenome]
MEAPSVIEPIPARMVNEYVYCPRLFYLEFVDRLFVDNDDVAQGRYTHRRVDTPTGDLDELPAHPAMRARSVWLSSEALGLSARIDLVEPDGEAVLPVDYKKGKAPAEGIWPSDEVQVGVQVLLLRDHGYSCDRAAVWYEGGRERRYVDFDDTLGERVATLTAEMREVASAARAPLPLVNSPKCWRCSLSGLCLPDETNARLARTELRPRHIVPRDPDHRPLYVTEAGAYVGISRGRVEVTRDREKLDSVRLIDVSQLSVFGRVQVSTQALVEFFARDVPVFYFSYGGWLQGSATGMPAKNVELRRRQIIGAADLSGRAAARMVEGKIRNSRTLLRRNSRSDVSRVVTQLGQLATSAASAVVSAELLGLEGAAARLYFSEFAGMLRGDLQGLPAFDFSGRNRRPPRDPVNAVLSLCYSLLVKDLLGVCLAVGFDPYLGVYHRPRFGRPALALDLAEEFRPLIADSVALTVLNNGELAPGDFIARAGGVQLTADGRRAVLRAYERRLAQHVTHPEFGYRISYRRILDVQARVLAAHLLGELPSYTPFVTR